ncbi:MAG: hypothetical protein QF752_12790 [Planctomycetota bacterium]|nr:hypothetical protein [Planctomycetota bacterium]
MIHQLTRLLVVCLLIVGCQPTTASRYNRGVSELQKGSLHEATRIFTDLIHANPRFGEAHFNLGSALARSARLYQGMGQQERALKIFSRAIASKKKARDLFRRGDFFVVNDPHERQSLLSHLDSILEDWGTIREKPLLIQQRIASIR